ncbi:MAG: hypothetical protein NTZ65_05215 [Candidatus Berkelbacteria bacterium]|nr:hypothetical protein [Candidatus Berkelbacteria bacterium]
MAEPKRLGGVFTCQGCWKVVNDPTAGSGIGTCPQCGLVRITEAKGKPIAPNPGGRGNNKSERG